MMGPFTEFDIEKWERGKEEKERVVTVHGGRAFVLLLLHEEPDEYEVLREDVPGFWGKAKGFVQEHPYQSALVAIPLGVAGAGAAATAAGFGAAGIVGGSIAAAVQSSIGNVAAGSAFAFLQSCGATGVFASMTSGGLAAGAAAGAAAAATNNAKTKGGAAESEEEDLIRKKCGANDAAQNEKQGFTGKRAVIAGMKLRIFHSDPTSSSSSSAAAAQ